MKRILSLALLCISLSVSAKKIELGLNGGITYDKPPHAAHPYVSYHVTLKGLYNITKHIQAGIGISNFNMSYFDYGLWEYNTTYPAYPLFNTNNLDYSRPEHMYSVKAYGNYMLYFDRITVYAGLSGGYASPIFAKETFERKMQPRTGYALGAQAGATYAVTKRVGINAELGAEKITLIAKSWQDYDADPNKTSLKQWIIPFTVGVRVKI
ncbi:MAG: hypothetical protein JST82_04620 [Bacteroidetes bacterium]|nr:hypothetical protein [Bacteroidota bacterium]